MKRLDLLDDCIELRPRSSGEENGRVLGVKKSRKLESNTGRGPRDEVNLR